MGPGASVRGVMPFDAVVVAAGSSSRFGEADKLTIDLEGRPVVAWSLAAFSSVEGLDRLVLVVAPERVDEFVALARTWLPGRSLEVVAGGARRRDSVEGGLRACRNRYVAVHDGARPLVTAELIVRVVAAADGRAGAIAATPVTDTIKEVRDGVVNGHPHRSRLWAAQTPQVVLRQAWLDAAGMGDDDETDDAAMLSRLGLECVVVDAGADNLKITRRTDLDAAAAILRRRMAP